MEARRGGTDEERVARGAADSVSVFAERSHSEEKRIGEYNRNWDTNIARRRRRHRECGVAERRQGARDHLIHQSGGAARRPRPISARLPALRRLDAHRDLHALVDVADRRRHLLEAGRGRGRGRPAPRPCRSSTAWNMLPIFWALPALFVADDVADALHLHPPAHHVERVRRRLRARRLSRRGGAARTSLPPCPSTSAERRRRRGERTGAWCGGGRAQRAAGTARGRRRAAADARTSQYA